MKNRRGGGGIYHKIDMERDLEEFASDPDAKAIFWNHTYNQAQMLDTAEEIQHAYATLEKQGCNETRLAIVNGYPILIQYASQGNNPSVDPLCLAFCFAVPGLALICKPQCWHCRAELKLKNLDKATQIDSIICNREPLLTCQTLSSFIINTESVCKK
jgi:hypothetical protein